MTVQNVAVLRGGPSDEYHISMQTGAGVLEVLKPTALQTKDIVITKEGQWLVDGFMRSPEQALVGVDVVFIALHGAYGEDGQVQRLLDRYAIPYTGSSALSSSIAMNKELTKKHIANIEVLIPQHMRVTQEGVTDPMQTALSIDELFNSQYIVKPTSGGSSLSTKRAHNAQELGIVLKELLQEHTDLLVEEYIQGREVTVGVLENFRNVPLYDLPVVEIIPPEAAGFFAAEVKYTGETKEICPAPLKMEVKKQLASLAQKVHTAMNLRHYSRSDFIIGKDGIYFLEVNTLPGLTNQSLFPKAMNAIGAPYSELVFHLIMQASGGTVYY